MPTWAKVVGFLLVAAVALFFAVGHDSDTFNRDQAEAAGEAATNKAEYGGLDLPNTEGNSK